MIRTEISLFLKNVPGELGKLAELMGASGINIDAITIQDASSYVQNLFEARGKSLKRIASSASYGSIRRDSAEFALIRILVDKVDNAIALLKENNYLFDTKELIAIDLENIPGRLSEVTKKFGEEGININYVYGSVSDADGKCLFVFCPEDIELASKIFLKE
ncbi:MAG: amino acid-binding protein [Desulfamplus sp.]|nr:amino acid-binding protein [Desulfamplus sp.]